MVLKYSFLPITKNTEKYKDIIVSIIKNMYFKQNKHFHINKSIIGPIIFVSNEYSELVTENVICEVNDKFHILNGAIFEAFNGPIENHVSSSNSPTQEEINIMVAMGLFQKFPDYAKPVLDVTYSHYVYETTRHIEVKHLRGTHVFPSIKP